MSRTMKTSWSSQRRWQPHEHVAVEEQIMGLFMCVAFITRD